MDKMDAFRRKKKEILDHPAPELKRRVFDERGMLPPRERIERLLDPGSFVELDMFVTHQSRDFGMDKRKIPAEGVITGYGTVHGRKVCVYAQDFSALGGTFGEMHGRKICALMDTAAKVGAPIVGICHSGGLRLQETLGPMEMFGRLFKRNSIYSGVVPQISIILGVVAGGQAYSPGLTDFVLMTRHSCAYIAGPAFVKAQTGQEIDDQALGGAMMHASVSGLVDILGDEEEKILEAARQLLGYLPSNRRELPPRILNEDDPARRVDALNSIVPAASDEPFDMHEVIRPVFDYGDFFEIKQDYAMNIIVGFARLGGRSVGVVTSQPDYLGGVIDIKAAEKAARFVRFCDAFNIPIITFQDAPAFMIGREMEEGGIIYRGAKLIHAYAEATVPMITVIVRKAYAGAYIALGSRYIGADLVFAWPGAEISSVSARTAAGILFRKEMENAENGGEIEALFKDYFDNYVSVTRAASLGHVNDIIEPAETRAVLTRSLDLLEGKEEKRPGRKHGNIPL